MPEKNSTVQSGESQGKRNLGFVKLRRGLKEHLHRSRMSSNASTLFVWLLLSAYHSGLKRGCVEANYEDLMRGLGWSYSMVRRTLDELIAKNYIGVMPAANQHEITVIKILKFEIDEGDSAVSTGEHSNDSAVSIGVLSAVSTGEHSSEQSTPSNPQSQRDLQASKNAVEVKKEKNERLDAVRRQVDAERLAVDRTVFSSFKRKKKLRERIVDKLIESGETLDRDLDDEERKAFAYVGYKPYDEPRNLPSGFVFTVWDVYTDYDDDLPLPGNVCSKIIDRCMSEQGRCKTLGADPSEYFYPLDFVEHRNQLRAQERISEQAAKASNGVRA